MKNKLLYLGMLILGMWLGYQGTLKYYPNLLYFGAQKKIGSEENVFKYGELPDADSRFVVKPNPDFLYSTCFYNLEDGPLHLTGDLPDSSYFSIAFYEPNTVNYFVKNDQQFSSKKLNMVIAQEGEELPVNVEDFELVTSPKKKGLVLIRLLVADNSEENVEKFKAIQQTVKVEKLK